METDIYIKVLAYLDISYRILMEIYQDGAFPNFEYHLFQAIWCVSALIW